MTYTPYRSWSIAKGPLRPFDSRWRARRRDVVLAAPTRDALLNKIDAFERRNQENSHGT